MASLDIREVATIKGMLARGDEQHHIAAYFGINSGRISEINTGLKWPEVSASPLATLPPAGPYMAGRSALKARDTLIALRGLIDDAINDIDLYEQGSDKG